MQAYSGNSPVAKAVALRESGQLAASLSLLHVACDENPHDPTAWHQLGIGYVRAGKTEHAQHCLLRAADLAPTSIEIASHLANVLVLRKDLDAAIRQAGKLVALSPGAAEFHLFLGNLYASKGRLDEALQCVRAAIERAPELAAAHTLLAQIQMARRQPYEARAAASRALQLEPNNAPAQQILQQTELTR